MNLLHSLDRFLAKTEWFGRKQRSEPEQSMKPFDIDDMIIHIRNMLNKEIEHLAFLIGSRGKVDMDIEPLIATSEYMIEHLKFRLDEYIKYKETLQ